MAAMIRAWQRRRRLRRHDQVPSALVGRTTRIRRPGDRAPVVHTPTVDDVGGDLARSTPASRPTTMHEDDLADVLGKEPVVLLFATPALCQSRVCGPVVDIAEQVKRERGDDVAFIHMEIYNDNNANKGLRPQSSRLTACRPSRGCS